MRLSNLTLRGKIALTIMLVALSVTAGGVLTYRSMQRLETASDWTDHTYVVLIGLNELEAQLLNLESGQRGLLLTGDERYLEPYNRAIGHINDSLQVLRNLTADNALQQRNLDRIVPLVAERISVMNHALDIYRERGLQAAISAIKTNEGLDLMRQIHEALVGMGNEERALLATRRTEEQISRHLNDVVVSIDAAVTSISLVFIALLIRRELVVRARLRQTIERLALQDELTGLPNRAAFHSRLKSALASAARNQRKLAVLYFDLDGFKEINDSFGRLAGDQLLHKIPERVNALLRESDYLARLDGDEFIVLIDEIAQGTDAGIVASKLIKAVSQPVIFANGGKGSVSASVGISLYPDDDTRAEQLIQLADEAMRHAKKAGKAKFRYHARSIPQEEA